MEKGTCKTCRLQFTTRSAYVHHVKYDSHCGHYERHYACLNCNWTGCSYKAAEQHMDKRHDETNILGTF